MSPYTCGTEAAHILVGAYWAVAGFQLHMFYFGIMNSGAISLPWTIKLLVNAF